MASRISKIRKFIRAHIRYDKDGTYENAQALLRCDLSGVRLSKFNKKWVSNIRKIASQEKDLFLDEFDAQDDLSYQRELESNYWRDKI